MRIMAVDDEPLVLKDLLRQLKKISSLNGAVIDSFTEAVAGLEFAKDNHLDLVFLDINMPEINGLEMAQKLKELQPHCYVIFLTSYAEYAVAAFKIKAQGYLLKPVTTEAIEEELSHYIVPRQDIYVQCFGTFAVFYKDVPIHFEREKAKELLAYLVDKKGAYVSQPEIIAALWGDRPDDNTTRSLLRNLIASLRKTFKSFGHDNFILGSRNEIAVNKSLFDCDYYDYLAGKTSGKADMNKYMANYSWL